MGGAVKEITSKSEWEEIIANAKEEGKVVGLVFIGGHCVNGAMFEVGSRP